MTTRRRQIDLRARQAAQVLAAKMTLAGRTVLGNNRPFPQHDKEVAWPLVITLFRWNSTARANRPAARWTDFAAGCDDVCDMSATNCVASAANAWFPRRCGG
jgi:hypothetical protein